jgi:UDP-N-acetylglucosamine acyltransferase
MAITIAPGACVDPRAELDDDVYVGPFCVVGPKVRIGRGTRLENNVTLLGRVSLGAENKLSPGVVIGGEPQDLSYAGSDTQVIIGEGNVIREAVTINRASEKEDGLTLIGDGNYLMACSHVAHDCKLGSNIVIANGTLLGGHVHVGDHATLSGGIGVHHFTSIGKFSFVAGLSRVLHDVPPFMLAEGSPARPRCINRVALKRNSFTGDAIEGLAAAHKLLYREMIGLDRAREALKNDDRLVPEVMQLLEFVRAQQDGKHGRSRERYRRAA